MSSLLADSNRIACAESVALRPFAQFVLQTLRERFSRAGTLWNAETSALLASFSEFPLDEEFLGALVPTLATSARPQLVFEADGWCLVAVPIRSEADGSLVCIAPFVTGPISEHDRVHVATLGPSCQQLERWAAGEPVWQHESLIRFADAMQAMIASESRAIRAEREIELVSENLATTYEEISLLYTVTKNLRISSTDAELATLALERLEECSPASSFAIHFLPIAAEEDTTTKSRTEALFLSTDACPLNEQDFVRLIEHLELNPSGGACVVNDRTTRAEDWPFPAVHQLIVVPLVEGANVFGWLAAFNHRQGQSFGTVESNLLGSLGTLLGIHCGNRALYRQQSELLRNIVRALVSAIDAKDPYTSGHSDRVARFAVRIAIEMRCNPKFINTIYMAGLLHDVGKIGIDDNVLRKAGRLTDLEFEHIKKHPELGYKILADLKPLADVLPAVLHHHEQWDGAGYPNGLTGDEIPKIARIMAVADAYDAMTSDRPYRIGLPEEKVEQIFREGRGKYWDPEVVDAFFAAHSEICEISRRERSQHVDAFQQQLM